jgi:hypothetical protein
LTAPIFFDCTSSIAQRASKGWLPTNIGLGSCAPIDVYSTEQSSIDAVYNSISATEDVTGKRSVRVPRVVTKAEQASSKGAIIIVRRKNNCGEFILERKTKKLQRSNITTILCGKGVMIG